MIENVVKNKFVLVIIIINVISKIIFDNQELK